MYYVVGLSTTTIIALSVISVYYILPHSSPSSEDSISEVSSPLRSLESLTGKALHTNRNDMQYFSANTMMMLYLRALQVTLLSLTVSVQSEDKVLLILGGGGTPQVSVINQICDKKLQLLLSLL